MDFSVSREQAAYLAGVIDGEGWIGLQRLAPSGVHRSPRFQFAVTIANTKLGWLETLRSFWGGRIHCHENEGHRNRRACYSLRFSSAETKRVLGHTLPYLMIKREQASLLLEFFPLAFQRRSLNIVPNLGADAEIVAKQEAIYQRLRELNRRGAKAVNVGGGPHQKRRCSFDGCEAKHYGHGYCWIHYRKFIVRGGPVLHEKTCDHCGKAFIARRADARCCSKTCADATYYAANGDQIRARVKAYKDSKKAVAKT